MLVFIITDTTSATSLSVRSIRTTGLVWIVLNCAVLTVIFLVTKFPPEPIKDLSADTEKFLVLPWSSPVVPSVPITLSFISIPVSSIY